MEIKSVRIQGFRSFNEEVGLNIENFPNGIIFVSGVNNAEPELGENGSGKSSLIEAIMWCLFGETSVNLKAGDVKNWNSSKECKVELDFDEHTLIRVWNPNSLTLDDKVVTQEELEKLIGMNFESFLYSIIIGQFSDKFIDKSPADKMNIFTEIVGNSLGKWVAYSEKAKGLRDKTEASIREIEKDIANFEGQLSSIDSTSLEEQEKEWKKKKDTEIELYLESINNYIEEKNTAEEAIKKLKGDLKKEKGNRESLEEISKELNALLTTVEIKQHNLHNELSSYKTMIVINKERIEGMNKIEGSVCPTCSQTVDEEIIKNEISNLKDKNKDLEFTAKQVLNDATEVGKDLEAIKEDIKDNEKKCNCSFNDIESIKRKISEHESATSIFETSKKDLEDKIKKAQQEKNPFTILIADNDNKEKEIRHEISDSNKKLEKSKQESEQYKYWVKGFKDIRLMLVSEALYEFEIEINNNMQSLGMKYWSVKLDIDSENKSGTVKKGFTVLVKSPINERLVPFKVWSGGEGQRIRLAVTLGLIDFIKNRRGVNCNVLFLDEPSQHLSNIGIENLLQLLRTKALDEQIKIFFIDHHDLYSSGIFNSSLTVVKDEDGSRIV